MTSIHCAPLLAAILLLIPAALAQSVASGQTFLDTPLGSDVTLPSMGGTIVSVSDLSIATADKAPNTPNAGAVTIGFTTATALSVGGQVTITVPKGYFSNVDSTKVITFTGTSATCTCVAATSTQKGKDAIVCTLAGAGLAPGAVTLSMAAGTLTTGAPTAAGFYNVATSTDREYALPASTPQIGGIIASPADFAFAEAKDQVPGTLNTKLIDIGFTTAFELPIGGKITIALPRKYFTAVDATKTTAFKTAVAVKATCVLTAGVVGTAVLEVDDADTIVCTTSGAKLAVGADVLQLAIGSVTTGAPQAGATYNVATSVDRAIAKASAKKTLDLGGTIKAPVDLKFNEAKDQVPGTVNTKTIEVGFETTTELPIGGKITIALPRKYFTNMDATKSHAFKTSKATVTCILAAGVVGTAVLEVDDADTIVCTTATDKVALGADVLYIAIGSVTTGAPQAGATYNVATSGDKAIAKASAKKTLDLGSTLTNGFAMAFTQDSDRIPGRSASNNATITLGFTAVSGLSIGDQISIILPQNFFSKVDSSKDNIVAIGTSTAVTAKCALRNAQSTVQTSISLDKTTVSTSGAVLTVRTIPDVAFGVTQLVIPLVGFSLDDGYTVECSANCAKADKGKVTATLANGVLTLTWAADNSITAKNTVTIIKITGVKTPAALGWATSGISGTLFNPSTHVVCTTAGAAVAANSAVTMTFVAGSVTIGTGQKASTFDVSTSEDLPIAAADRKATPALGGGLTGGKALSFANAQDAIPGKVNSGPISLGATLATSVPIGGQFLLTFPSNYFTNVNPTSVVTLTKGSRRSLLQTSTLSCVRTAGTPNDQITCTLSGAASGTGAVVLTFPAGSLTTGLPSATTGGFNLATANPPVGTTRIPYFPKASSSAHGVAWLLVAVSALLACF